MLSMKIIQLNMISVIQKCLPPRSVSRLVGGTINKNFSHDPVPERETPNLAS